MDKIELNEIEEKLLQDAYTSYLKNKNRVHIEYNLEIAKIQNLKNKQY